MALKKAVVLLFFVFLFSSVVIAAEEESIQDILSSVFEPLAGKDFNFAKTYDDYGKFIDLILYIVFFIGVAQFTLMKRFEGVGGKLVVVVVGIMLAVGLSAWAYSQNPPFTLKSFGPIAGAIVSLFIFVSMFKIVRAMMGGHGWGEGSSAFFITFIFVWYCMQAVVPQVTDWIYSVPVIGGILPLFINIAMIMVIIHLAKRLGKGVHFWAGKPEAAAGGGSGLGDVEKAAKKAEEEVEKAEGAEKDEAKVEKKEIKVEKQIIETLTKFQQDLSSFAQQGYTKQNFENMEKDLEAIRKEVNKLRKLEVKEGKDENIRAKLGMKSRNSTTYKLLEQEKSYLTAFDKLIETAIASYKTNIGLAKSCVAKAIECTKILIKINLAQEKEFSG